ncbi:isoprenoid synthase domain-containing protein [Armillaria novae-zelandiae]|uniref:Terpene synthase n=1 Tax=Armillaria novae-zelandiae TaxID=153914 RepID=A0AA39PHW5_9AGAR|nr:isoprenoid synthase domain-containing protein [Armillaria novae-zelandiae]
MLVTLPHLLKDWPVEGTLCSHYKAVAEAHNAWVKDSGFFSPKQTYALLKLDATLLCSMIYPDCDEVMLRLLSDLFAVSFLFDDHFERSKAEDVLEQTKAFGRAYSDPDSSLLEPANPLLKVTQDLAIAMRKEAPEAFPTLAVTWETWMQGICEEALFHAAKKQFDVTFDEFIEHRLRSAACEWALGAILLQCKLPKNLLDHPVIAKMRYEICLLAAISNDVYSFNIEQARGHGGNVVIISMKQYSFDAQEALDYIGGYSRQHEEHFMELTNQAPSTDDPDVNSQIKAYISSLAKFLIGTNNWHLESSRYRGNVSLESLRKDRQVTLLPKTEKHSGAEIEVVTHPSNLNQTESLVAVT